MKNCIIHSHLPDVVINEKSIYEKLSKTHWTLIVCGKEKIKLELKELKILHVPEKTYDSRYILIQPDWIIAHASNHFDESVIKKTAV